MPLDTTLTNPILECGETELPIPHIDGHRAGSVVPTLQAQDGGVDRLPKQGDHAPWRHSQDCWSEKHELPRADLEDGTLGSR
jgi:hypothetical protein